MPELSRFYNIVIKMLFKDTAQHNKPHIHVFYNEYEASMRRNSTPHGIRRSAAFPLRE
jgi:hypothetical protein